MLTWLLIILIILWLLGYVNIGSVNLPNLVLFNINGQPITLWNLLILFVIISIIGILPSPFREIAGVFLILWILSLLGIIAIAGLSNLLVIALIVGLILLILRGAF
jgi:hypothetical protein